MRRFAILALGLFLIACDSEENRKQAENPENQATEAAPAPDKPPKAAPVSEAEIARADQVLAFANSASRYLETGFHSLADTFHRNAANYLKTFRLPPRPATGARRSGRLTPEKGLFNAAEAAQITAGLQGMDKALDDLLGHYAELEKYVADSKIRDDGKKGAELVAKINSSHERFVQARASWLAVVQAEARQAEEILLAEHPLRRQIMAGQGILEQIRQARDLLLSGAPDRELLSACITNVEDGIALGAKPPFPERPGLERLYRAFLQRAREYAQALALVASEGAHERQLRELQSAAKYCIEAWNEFAGASNGDP